MESERVTGRRIAVIGGGISGITAGYRLSGTDHVTLFEADGRLGGHAGTHLVMPPTGPPAGLDTGFIVYNERTYPLLTAMFARFKADPANRGQVMDRGLWRYTRHPNYFGDFCMWWGLSLISLGSAAGLAFAVAPLLMTFVLTRGSGAAMTDRRMTASRPGYADYMARTSGFFLLPRKRRAA